MRWRSSSSPSPNESSVPLDKQGPLQEEQQQQQQQESHEAASTTASSSTSSTVSSPLVGGAHQHDRHHSSQEDMIVDATADSSLSASNATHNHSNSSNNNNSRNHRQAIDLTAMDVPDSDTDPDGDPPYPQRNKQQQSQHHHPQSHDNTSEDDVDGDSGEGKGPASSGGSSSPQSDPHPRGAHAALGTGSGSGSGIADNDYDDYDQEISTVQTPLQESNNHHSDSHTNDAGDDQEVPWKPQATQSTCEFTHTITNYSQKRDSGCKKAEYSATTVDEFGNRWRLIVYVNGNGRASNHHLSLFLQVADADDLPFGWKKAVSYVLTLEHPAGPNHSYAKRNPDKTFKLCPKAIDWGWSQFITSDRIQQEGFVQEDSLVVRASVTVKSSSVSIDLEDSELYLKCAVEEGKPDAVQLCLDQGASVNCQFKDDLYTPLHTACSSSTGDDDDEEEDGEECDDDDPTRSDDYDDEDEPNSHGSRRRKRGGSKRQHTSGGMRVLQLLLEKGADGNACNKWRETPLLIAANNGHRSAVEALLKHGADPSLCSEAGWSALTFAAHKGYDDIVQLLLSAGAPVNCRVTEDASTPLHKACAGSKPGHLAAVQLLLANHADVHALNKWRETPLLTAANHGQAGAVDALLKAGADPCKCTDTGWSPLSIAAYKGHDDVVKLLLEEGAPTEEADPTLSALLQAATKGLPDTVELLLKHGADHTVTTKKGDTALSILVEQNLIDAAVDMVTEYNASVPRCSRDRKKVQRARLLINLRMKQRQREGTHVQLVADDEDGDAADDSGDEGTKREAGGVISSGSTAQHQDENSHEGVVSSNGQSKKAGKKNKKKKTSAEQQAKAAEEALLLELEQEDAERQKQEQEASKKSAKKRKKKERERQQKKEQEEKRIAEEKERELKLRKEREEREMKERAERERLAAIRRKEEEEERKRLIEKQKREQQQQEELRKKELQKKKQQQLVQAEAEKKAKQAVAKPGKRQTSTPAAAPAVAPRASASVTRAPQSVPQKPAVASTSRPTGKNRGWETKGATTVATEQKSVPDGHGSQSLASSPIPTSSAPTFRTPHSELQQPMDLFSSTSGASPFTPFNVSLLSPPAPGLTTYTKSEPILNGFASSASLSLSSDSLEVPAVGLFRRDKVSELLQRCAQARSSSEALSVVDEATVKNVLYRWMVRAAHETTSYVDCIIPSWTDFDMLASFCQRQFISLSRKGMNGTAPRTSMVSMEALKEAGLAMAVICQNFAKEVADFRRRVDEQLPPDWNDGSMGLKASDMTMNGSSGSGTIMIDWANRGQVYLSPSTFRKLRERYTGVPGRLLCSIFVTKIRYDTKRLVTSDTDMDFCLSPDTQSILSSKAGVNAEVGSDTLSVFGNNVLWGQFGDVDTLFGGFAPFGKTDGGQNALLLHGGSVVVLTPLDNMVAARYVHIMFDLLLGAEQGRVPLSFVVFLRSECFHEGNISPTLNDLYMLDPRFRDRTDLVIRSRELAPGQHSFYNDKVRSFERSQTGSLLVVLQNGPGQSRYNIEGPTLNEICLSLASPGGLSTPALEHPPLPVMSEMSFSAPEFIPSSNRNKELLVGSGGSGFFSHSHHHTPASPVSHHSILPDFGSSDFGSAFSGSLSHAFSAPVGPTSRSTRSTRGRLFDLVDDGGEDDHGTADVVSGMLGNLNMDDLFSRQPTSGSTSGDIDIEAISLMGITTFPPSSTSGSLQPRRNHFG